MFKYINKHNKVEYMNQVNFYFILPLPYRGVWDKRSSRTFELTGFYAAQRSKNPVQ